MFRFLSRELLKVVLFGVIGVGMGCPSSPPPVLRPGEFLARSRAYQNRDFFLEGWVHSAGVIRMDTLPGGWIARGTYLIWVYDAADTVWVVSVQPLPEGIRGGHRVRIPVRAEGEILQVTRPEGIQILSP